MNMMENVLVMTTGILHAHIRALLAWMEEDDREEFFANAEKQGF